MSTLTTRRPRRSAARESAMDTALVKSRSGRVFGYTALAVLIIGTLFPFYWMLRTAFSTTRTMFSDPTSLLPVDPTFGAFARVLGLSSTSQAVAEGGSGAEINFGQYMINSIIVCTLITVFQITFSSMAAYAFALLKWPGRDALFSAFLVALMVPGIFTTIPNFILVKELGLLNSYLGIALPAMFMTPFAVFFLRQFYLGVNRSLLEAAEIDGAGHWRIFTRIASPIVMPQIVTLGILQFIMYWNDYLWPFLIGQSEDSKLLTVGLGVFRSQTPQGNPDWAGLMAGALIAAIPVMIIAIVFGRRIVGSIQSSGIK